MHRNPHFNHFSKQILDRTWAWTQCLAWMPTNHKHRTRCFKCWQPNQTTPNSFLYKLILQDQLRLPVPNNFYCLPLALLCWMEATKTFWEEDFLQTFRIRCPIMACITKCLMGTFLSSWSNSARLRWQMTRSSLWSTRLDKILREKFLSEQRLYQSP
jgi:hypothetical protein